MTNSGQLTAATITDGQPPIFISCDWLVSHGAHVHCVDLRDFNSIYFFIFLLFFVTAICNSNGKNVRQNGNYDTIFTMPSTLVHVLLCLAYLAHVHRQVLRPPAASCFWLLYSLCVQGYNLVIDSITIVYPR